MVPGRIKPWERFWDGKLAPCPLAFVNPILRLPFGNSDRTDKWKYLAIGRGVEYLRGDNGGQRVMEGSSSFEVILWKSPSVGTSYYL